MLLLTLWLTGVSAQEAILTAGGDATGSGGSVSYSVGQIAYTSVAGTAGSLTQGVQQSYEITTITGAENEKITLEISAFPNPTKNILTLTVNDIERANLSFQLFDVNGKFLQAKKIMDNQTAIDLSNCLSGIYFVKILMGNLELKTFKIIKN